MTLRLAGTDTTVRPGDGAATTVPASLRVMGIREHPRPEITTISELKAALAAHRANVPGNSPMPPTASDTYLPDAEETVCPTCNGRGKVMPENLVDHPSGE